MKLNITKEWLERRLAETSDNDVSAGRADAESFEELKKDAERRKVTPTAFSQSSTQLGKVVCFIREQRGWSRLQLAEIAGISESEITNVETEESYEPSPRAVVYLADALGLSRAKLTELVGFVVRDSASRNPANDREVRFAARSKNLNRLSDDEYEAVRTLVEILMEKKPGE